MLGDLTPAIAAQTSFSFLQRRINGSDLKRHEATDKLRVLAQDWGNLPPQVAISAIDAISVSHGKPPESTSTKP